jgi:hypothetical protein
MKTNEIDDVMALLERVLPDPAGFAERLFDQMVTRLAGAAQFVGQTAPAFDPNKIIVEPSYTPAGDDPPTDFNLLLASALGACDCWGLRADCAVCKGDGSAGWIHPDVDLFQEFVGPAVEKLSVVNAEGAADDRVAAPQDEPGKRTTQGGST